MLRQGFYESEVLEAIVAELGGQGVLWDIGANLGLQGLTAKTLVPDAEVVCFEPSPAILGRLWRHRQINDVDVAVVTIALSDATGLRQFHIAPDGNPGMSTLSPWSGAKYQGRMLVQTMRGDDLVDSGHLRAPTVIKLDVEGHELEVLRGLSGVLGSSCKAVIFEDSAAVDTPCKMLLASAGFSCTALTRRETSEHALTNFVARRK